MTWTNLESKGSSKVWYPLDTSLSIHDISTHAVVRQRFQFWVRTWNLDPLLEMTLSDQANDLGNNTDDAERFV